MAASERLRRRRTLEVSPRAPSWSDWPGLVTIWTRLSGRPSASGTSVAVTPAPAPLMDAISELRVVVPSVVMVWPLMLTVPVVTV
jgi:hypothetical protein